MRRTSALFTLLILVIAVACNSSAREMLDRAAARWREGNYDDAIRLNTLLHQRDPHGKYAATALMNIANMYYLNLRQLDRAIETYQKIVEDLPETPEALQAREKLAEIYANEMGDFTQAIFEYEKLLESPNLENRAETRFQMACAYFKINDFDRALREFRRILDQGISGHLVDQVNLKIASIYQIRKRYEDALEPLQATSVSPCLECRQRAILSLTDTYESLFDFERAIESIKRLDRTPDNEVRIHREVRRLTEKQVRVNSPALP